MKNEAERGETTSEDRDSPDAIAAHAREGIAKSAAELRKQRVPIETEPPTVYRP